MKFFVVDFPHPMDIGYPILSLSTKQTHHTQARVNALDMEWNSIGQGTYPQMIPIKRRRRYKALKTIGAIVASSK
jgi:hypothetical protein